MSLVKNIGTIGGLTLIVRIFGFARDMILARVLGAGLAADAWQLAFTLPNTFRRLFAEGAFSVAFVPMYTRKLGADGGEQEADAFANEVLSVFIWVLLGFTAIAMLAMPGIVWLLAREYQSVPGKFELSVSLSRITFPYLMLVSLVALLSGILNARSRFAPGAIVPVVLNVVLIIGIGIGYYQRENFGGGDEAVAHAQSVALAIAGMLQLAYMWWAARKAGVRLKISTPKISPDIKKLGLLILPATFGAGIYQISQLVDTFFATNLPQGSLSLLKFADRLNQMPLGIFGIALGTAILPMLARHIQSGEDKETQRIQANAVEIAMLLCLPAAVALSICAEPITAGLFAGGKMTSADTALMAQILVALVSGLPAYVLIKVFQPAFFSREDTRTTVYIAAGALVFNVAINFPIVARYGIVGLAAATAVTSWLNVMTLYTIMHRRGWYHLSRRLAGRILRQALSCLVMALPLFWLVPTLEPYWRGSGFERLWSLTAIVTVGGVIFFVAAFFTGALDKELLGQIRRKKASDANSG